MRRRMFQAVILLSIFLAAAGCKDQAGPGNAEKNVFVTSGDGAAVKKSPDAGSESMGIIPFGSEIVINESTVPDDRAKGWVSTRWNNSEGWIKNDMTGSESGITGKIQSAYDAAGKFLSVKIRGQFEGPFTVKKTFFYTGGEMEPATMFLLSNGVLVVNSSIFSEKTDMFFFRYEILSEGRLLKIYFDDDSRAAFSDYSAVESGSKGVFKIDQAEKSITYQVKNGSFSFFNWVFRESDAGSK